MMNVYEEKKALIKEDEEDAFKVYIRVRPLSNRELTVENTRKKQKIVKTEDNLVNWSVITDLGVRI